jgi:hypothetical protein
LSGEESNSSDSRDEIDDTLLSIHKKRRLVVFESPPDSPNTIPNAPFHRTLVATGSWEEFKSLVEMAELLYKRDIKGDRESDREPVTAVVVSPEDVSAAEANSQNFLPTYSQPIAEVSLDTDRRGVPLKLSLPEYEFGLRSVSHPISMVPSFSYWRS